MLDVSSYPYVLKQRIKGPKGHLSNQMAGKTISSLINTGLKTVMLGHLSKETTFQNLRIKTVVEELIQITLTKIQLNLVLQADINLVQL